LNKESFHYFKAKFWPYLLIAPQLILVIIFFLWPAIKALQDAFYRSDAFGIHYHFVWFANFRQLFTDSGYLYSFLITIFFAAALTLVAMAAALYIANKINQVLRGKSFYHTLMIWPYAVAPAIAGMLWRFLFDPAIGLVTYVLAKFNYPWNFTVHSGQAIFLIIIAGAWQQISYNFVFYLAGLQAIPDSILEAATIDGASPIRRFWSIVFPLLSPMTFFLIAMNFIYAFFNTFGLIQVVTEGGPDNATNILVYRVYTDGFIGLDFGKSAAESVILMIIVGLLTILHFKYIEKMVHYK